MSDLQIQYKSISEITPYANNPRKNDSAVDFVANSIREFGFKVPVIISSGGVIVAGHTRVKAAKKLGIDKVPCVVADDLSEEKLKALRLADNKVGEMAEWDLDLLAQELDELKIDFDMSDFGFDLDFDIDEPAEIVEDEAPEPPEEPKTKIGDLWLLGRWVYCKKCGKKHYIP